MFNRLPGKEKYIYSHIFKGVNNWFWTHTSEGERDLFGCEALSAPLPYPHSIGPPQVYSAQPRSVQLSYWFRKIRNTLRIQGSCCLRGAGPPDHPSNAASGGLPAPAISTPSGIPSKAVFTRALSFGLPETLGKHENEWYCVLSIFNAISAPPTLHPELTGL